MLFAMRQEMTAGYLPALPGVVSNQVQMPTKLWFYDSIATIIKTITPIHLISLLSSDTTTTSFVFGCFVGATPNQETATSLRRISRGNCDSNMSGE